MVFHLRCRERGADVSPTSCSADEGEKERKTILTHPFAKARAGSTSNSACRTIPPDNGIKALISAMLKTGPQASIPTNLTTRGKKKISKIFFLKVEAKN